MYVWGKKIPISIAGGVDSGTKLRVLPGLNVQSFRIVLRGLIRGASGRVKGFQQKNVRVNCWDGFLFFYNSAAVFYYLSLPLSNKLIIFARL